MNIIYPMSLLLVAATGLSCSRENPKSPQLIEANRLHLEAIKISHQLEQNLDSLAPLVPNAVEKARIDSLRNLIEDWEENVIEVPGFPHAHDHTHGPHKHKSAPNMTDESMLDYQRQSKEAILELKQAIGQINGLHK